jgi:hypothetical protein
VGPQVGDFEPLAEKAEAAAAGAEEGGPDSELRRAIGAALAKVVKLQEDLETQAGLCVNQKPPPLCPLTLPPHRAARQPASGLTMPSCGVVLDTACDVNAPSTTQAGGQDRDGGGQVAGSGRAHGGRRGGSACAIRWCG